jgi:nucleoside-diphosphate-sugar epimerase
MFTKVLVTGGAGQLGSILVSRLLERGYNVRVLDLPIDTNKERVAHWKVVEANWGDITDYNAVRSAVKGVDGVFHLAYILPPLSEQKKLLSRRVNIGGTENVLKAIKEEGRDIKLVFTSSVCVYGITVHEEPPIKPDHPVDPVNCYACHKINCEELIRNSSIRYTILRLAGVLNPWMELSPESLEVSYVLSPLDNRVEFVHVADVCTALINAFEKKETDGQTYIIGGGKKCQTIFREFLQKLGNVFNFEFEWDRFTKEPVPLDWYDTTESQKVLQYQQKTLNDYINDLKKFIG